MLLIQMLPGMWRGVVAGLLATVGASISRVRSKRPARPADPMPPTDPTRSTDLTPPSSIDRRLDDVLLAAGAALHECNLTTGAVRSIVGPIDHIAGWTAEQWRTIGHQELIHPDDVANYWIDGAKVCDGQVFDRVARFRHRDGGWVWLRDVSRVTALPDGSMGLSGLTLDVTAVTEALAAAEYRGTYDQLTGLPNRFTFLRELESRLRSGDDVTLLLIDLNRFREINDALTHAVGDEVLIQVADRLDRDCGPGDVAARLGGDQFAMLRSRSGTRIATSGDAAHLVDVLTRPMSVRGLSVAVSLSIGSARRDDEPLDAEMMMRWADIALAEAKRRHLRYQAFGNDLESATVLDLLLSASIPEALANGEIIAHFQPKVDLVTGRTVAAEALTRWEHPEHGLLSAAQFTHLVGIGTSSMLFTETMIDQGLQAIARCQAVGRPIPVAVNIAAHVLLDAAFPGRVAQMCRSHGVAPSSLILELTEEEIMETTVAAVQVMAALHEMDVVLSIDDFGTGYSSFARLAHLPIGEIKVDRQFAASAVDSPGGVILGSMIGLGHGLHHRVVVEGIETVAQAELARSLGAEVGQGFLYGRAMPIQLLIERLDAEAASHA